MHKPGEGGVRGGAPPVRILRDGSRCPEIGRQAASESEADDGEAGPR
jgi:hypothetical protein